MKTTDMTDAQNQLIEAAQEVCEMLQVIDQSNYFNGYKMGTQRIKLKSAIEAVKKESGE